MSRTPAQRGDPSAWGWLGEEIEIVKRWGGSREEERIRSKQVDSYTYQRMKHIAQSHGLTQDSPNTAAIEVLFSGLNMAVGNVTWQRGNVLSL